MLNLNLKHISENYDFPSELHDSSMEESHLESISREQQPIKAEDQYQLEKSYSQYSQASRRGRQNSNEFMIDHSADDSSLDHDTFLQMIKQEHNRQAVVAKVPSNNTQEYLMVNKTNIQLTLLHTQTTEESIIFTNPTSNPIKMKFNECPFQIQSQKTLNYVLAEQLEIILEPWERIELHFLIKPKCEEYGDIIEIAVITANFMNRDQVITPVNIKFHIHFVIPKLRLKFQGNSEVVSLAGNKIPISRIKANKIGEYELEISLIQGLSKMNLSIESRGKLTTNSDNVTLYEQQAVKIKLRQKGRTTLKEKEKSALIFRPISTKLCFVFGIQLLP